MVGRWLCGAIAVVVMVGNVADRLACAGYCSRVFIGLKEGNGMGGQMHR